MKEHELIRAFWAVETTRELQAELAVIQNQLKTLITGVRWTRIGNIHLTLKFLGDTPPSEIQSMVNELKKPLSSLKAFRLPIETLGIFPDLRRPRIIWLGTENVPEDYYRLVEIIDENMVKFGFERERRKQIPHLTIGRIKRLKKSQILSTIVDQFKKLQVPELAVDRVSLVKSVLKPHGPEYAAMAKFNLISNGGES